MLRKYRNLEREKNCFRPIWEHNERMNLEEGMIMWNVNWVTWLILENQFDALELLRLFSTTDSSALQTTKK